MSDLDSDANLRNGMWSLFIRGVRNETVTIDVHEDASVEDFMKLCEKKTGIPPREQRIIHAGKQLETTGGKKLKDYHGIKNKSTLFMVLRLSGGSDSLPQHKVLDDAVELTDEPDMITWDEDPDGQRAKMSCGHAIGPESLTKYCQNLLASGKYRFLCPYVSLDGNVHCNKEWDYVEVRRLAVLTKQEQSEFEVKISENYLRKAIGIQECPKCHSLCQREDTKHRRVVCVLCSRQPGVEECYEFCWYCFHEWVNKSSLTECGNAECNGEDPRIKVLRDASTKEVVGVKCPSCRACPSCGMLIEHLRDCKHMSCRCGAEFCFICLKKKEGDKWQCGSYETHCIPAARQTTIPGA